MDNECSVEKENTKETEVTETDSDDRIFDEMKRIVQENDEKQLVGTEIEQNVELPSSDCKAKETSRNHIQIETLNDDLYTSKTSESTEMVEQEFELLDPDNLTEIDEIDEQSCNEELDDTILINYKKANLANRYFWDCPYCPYKAKQLHFIHKHIIDTHASVTCYKCQKCQYAHAQLSLVMSHYNRRHQKIKYQCPDCKYKFTTVWNCQGHILTRHPKKAQKLLQTVMEKRELDGNNRRCPFCEFKDNSPGVLKRHVEKSHAEVIRFKCLYCTYNNIDTDDIMDHMKDVHPEEIEDINI